MSKRDEVVKDVLEPENLPPKKVRMIDKNILQSFFMGDSVHDIAVQINKTEGAVRSALARKEVRRELKRLDTRVESELVRQKVGASRTLMESAVKAAKQLVKTMETSQSEKDKNWAALKILEYDIGKPKVSVEVSAGRSALTDEDWDEMEKDAEEGKKGGG